MQVYELCYLILPSIPEEGLSDVVSKIKAIIEKTGGKEFDGESPSKIDLAYTMTKTIGASRYVVSDAYIGWVKFDLPAEALAKEGLEHPVEKIKVGISKIEELLRFLVVKAPRETVFTFAKVEAQMVNKSIGESKTEEEIASMVE
jgi:ribosomal protein S6